MEAQVGLSRIRPLYKKALPMRRGNQTRQESMDKLDQAIAALRAENQRLDEKLKQVCSEIAVLESAIVGAMLRGKCKGERRTNVHAD